MTRRWFFQALAGATALIGSAKRMLAKPKSVTVGFPTVLRKGDRLSVAFTAEGLGAIPVTALSINENIRVHYVSLPNETIFIAPETCVVTDVKVYYGTPPSEPAPILWTKTSAGK